MNSLYNLNEETSMMISIQTFLTVNLIYISGFSIYRFYQDYQYNKIQKINEDLKNENKKLIKTIETKDDDNKYLLEILKEGENLLKTHRQIKVLHEENASLNEDYSSLEEDLDEFVKKNNKLTQKNKDLNEKINLFTEDKEYNNAKIVEYRRRINILKNDCNTKIVEYKRKMNILKDGCKTLLIENDDLKNQLIDLDADMFDKDTRLTKLEELKITSDKIYQENKYEIRKLRKRV